MVRQNEQERFYSSIASHYSSIFPFNPAQLAFLEVETGNTKGKTFLDAGCGTGELAFALAERGAEVTAIDLNEALLDQAKEYRNHPLIKYRLANMLDIEKFCKPSSFDGAICFGNTLVHITGPDEILFFFKAVRKILKPSGCFMIQILNYDFIFREKIGSLPTIENDSIKFERKYRFSTESRNIRFCTKLTLKASGDFVENETGLLGLGKTELLNLMRDAGFYRLSFFADFGHTPFHGNHLPLVAVGQNSL